MLRATRTARAAFESDYGARSLDEKLGADTTATLGDLLVDHSAIRAFDRLDNMRAGRAVWRKAA